MTLFDPTATPDARLAAVATLVKQLKADTKPILLGPWRSEIGFEALYWMAFLKRLASQVPHFAERAIVVTRGGMGSLYKGLANGGVDLYALRSVQELRRRNLADHLRTKLQKQYAPMPYDDELVRDAATAAGVQYGYHLVHPAWMYWSCAPFWDEVSGIKHLSHLCDYAPIPKPPLMKDSPLPPSYVAVKFYNRATFPYMDPRAQSHLAEFIAQTVGVIAKQTPVVWLKSSPEFDDHVDIPIVGQNVMALDTAPTPEQNLFQQATVLAHATAFVGVYGGVAQLALRMGVPSASFYHTWGATAHAHLSLSSQISKMTNTEFLVGNIDDTHLWRQILSLPLQVAPKQTETAMVQA